VIYMISDDPHVFLSQNLLARKEIAPFRAGSLVSAVVGPHPDTLIYMPTADIR